MPNSKTNFKTAEIDTNKITSLDDFYTLTQQLGSGDKAISNNLYGISSNGVKGVLPENRDSYGLVFFTRPQLNLSKKNIMNIRKMYSLLNNDPNSIHRYVRCMLDPRLETVKVGANTADLDTAGSTLVNNELAFIPVFTNNIKSMSGWPDVALPTFTSKEGLRKEQWTIGDGAIEIYDSFDLDCTFKNMKDEPITMLVETWVQYIAQVFEGNMSPYIDMIAENEIDYNTRIYRLVLDETKRYVKKIAATGASFPVNVPTGKMFDFTDENKYNTQTKELNLRFKCVGALYNDDILIREFNNTAGIFNPEIRKMANGYVHNLDKIPESLLTVLNYRGIPYINEETLELEWWIDKNSLSYKRIIASLKK